MYGIYISFLNEIMMIFRIFCCLSYFLYFIYLVQVNMWESSQFLIARWSTNPQLKHCVNVTCGHSYLVISHCQTL